MIPESEVQSECDNFVADTSRARLTDYISDIFTTEDHLLDSVGLLGPTATNIAITPQFQFYRGGVFYNETECVSYVDEPVPPECQEIRAGRLSYTCLTKASIKGRVQCIFIGKSLGYFLPSPPVPKIWNSPDFFL